MITVPVPSNSLSFVRSHNCDAFITTKSFPGDSSKYLATCPLSHPSDVLKSNWRRRDMLDGAMPPLTHPNEMFLPFLFLKYTFISFCFFERGFHAPRLVFHLLAEDDCELLTFSPRSPKGVIAGFDTVLVSKPRPSCMLGQAFHPLRFSLRNF